MKESDLIPLKEVTLDNNPEDLGELFTIASDIITAALPTEMN